MRRLRPLLLVGLAGAVVGACGGSTTSSGSGPIPRDQFASRYASAFCDNIGGCCRSSGYPYDPGACKTALAQGISQIFSSARIRYNAQLANQCLAEAAQEARACSFLVDFTGTACTNVFTGTQAVGQPCQSYLECAPVARSVECTAGGAATGGQSGTDTCTAKPDGKPGDACDETCAISANGISCSGLGLVSGGVSDPKATCYTNDGVYCDQNGVCKSLIAIGRACSDSLDCVSGAYCNNGSCSVKRAVGSPCATDDACKGGAYCDMGSGKCANDKIEGATCSSDNECQSDDCESGVCSNGALNEGTCTGQSTSSGSGGTGGSNGAG